MKRIEKIRHVSGFAFLMTIYVLLAGCSKDNSYGENTSGNNGGQPGANEVWIQGMAFNPASITVTAGTTIKWTNKDGVAHTVTADDNSFDSGNIATNGTFSHTFSTAGTISYYCKIHPMMKASVVVSSNPY
ncbi:MAG: cupredoxin family copper-binding protein [Methanococcaceae archaeon]